MRLEGDAVNESALKTKVQCKCKHDCIICCKMLSSEILLSSFRLVAGDMCISFWSHGFFFSVSQELLGSPHRPYCTVNVTPPGNGTHSFPSRRPSAQVASVFEFCYPFSRGEPMLWVWLPQTIKMTALSNYPYLYMTLKELIIITRCDNNCYPSFSFGRSCSYTVCGRVSKVYFGILYLSSLSGTTWSALDAEKMAFNPV